MQTDGSGPGLLPDRFVVYRQSAGSLYSAKTTTRLLGRSGR